MLIRIRRVIASASLGLGVAVLAARALAQQPITRVSVDANGNQGDGNSGNYRTRISADGRHVVFESVASNLVSGDTNAASDVFACDLLTGAIVLVSRDSAGNLGNDASYEAL